MAQDTKEIIEKLKNGRKLSIEERIKELEATLKVLKEQRTKCATCDRNELIMLIVNELERIK
ncbi:hypothetical protein [Massilibacteroides sp.]|uniref:hypothetical protein n=1 Tax=Massilibacteroides sp. TaxID=2034766 RepID=UPI00260B28F2|nr:hypothetical protein [Massilibacteroides sp.]MDD4515661.1 hypothetical protein [Massilibacteroides sp.]